MSWTDRRAEYEQVARNQSPVVILITKEHGFWRCVATLLWLASAGRFRRETFLDQYATTLGPIQAYPQSWPTIPEWLIVHESRHTWQCERFGWLVPVLGWFFGRGMRTWVGLIPMGIVYILLPLPTLFAWGRMRLELDADIASWAASLENGWQTPDEVYARALHMADQLSGAPYLWAWPRSWTRAIFIRAVERTIHR